ncbi:MAG: GTP 3',8-cyclase MoaA [Magnetococcales bacterium]|nr:GTP 3',8-cyclase MoaA [Magnetococcales bacterium]
MTMIDSFGRTISYLRVSVTDRCNMKCLYCRVGDDRITVDNQQLLSFEELTRLIRIFTELGINKIRLTGGEPLLRKNLVDLIRTLNAIPGLHEVSLSTNALLLERFAGELYRSGLKRVNISLDSLQPDTFALVTRGGRLDGVLRGIQAAVAVGLQPVKINMVVMRGVNDHEIPAMIDFARNNGLVLRFIETMPIGEAGARMDTRHMPAAEIIQKVQACIGGLPLPSIEADVIGNGPANYFCHLETGTTIGIISAKSRNFCATCNRMRLTSRGELVFCLGNTGRIDLREPLRSAVDDDMVRQLIAEAVIQKPAGHTFLENHGPGASHAMSKLGG